MEGSEDAYEEKRSFILDNRTIAKVIDWASEPEPELYREVLAMQYVYQHTTIPVPRVYGVWADPSGSRLGWIAMDYIHGQRLDHAWPNLSIWEKLRTAWILRSYVRQLRMIQDSRSSIPGPLGLGPKRCPGLVISSLREQGPFPNSEALNTFINNLCQKVNNAEVPSRYRKPGRLFFTHNDINMRNVILGTDGRIWLIDWDFAGFFPRYFEFAASKLEAEFFCSPAAPISWRRCIPFIADPYFDRYRWIFGFV